MSNPSPAIRHLYVHVPFCPSICPYCDFHVSIRHAGQVEAYLRELAVEARELAARYVVQLDTVYLGGGTPSFLRDHEMAALVGIIRGAFGWPDGEATLEVNPGTVNSDRASLWRDLGFNRASVGVQSFSDDLLRYLGRTHDALQGRRAVETLAAAGFRVSLDIITALPNQDPAWEFARAVELPVEHLSAYTLTIEEGTPFHTAGVTVPEEAEERALLTANDVLPALGFERYEVSNFARPGAQSLHNLAYWRNRHYFGLGPGASGHYPTPAHSNGAVEDVIAERIKNPPLPRWLQGERGAPEAVSRLDYLTDALYAGLRLTAGVNITDLSARAGLDLLQVRGDAISRLQSRGLLDRQGDTLKATTAGLWVLNQVVRELL